MIFWKSWNWPSYSRECVLYWLRWHQVDKTSSLSVGKPKSASQHSLLWMWRNVGTQYRSCLSAPTDYEKSHASGSTIQNSAITGHSSQPRMNGPLLHTSWKYWGHSDMGLYGCRRGIQSHCITLSQSTMTYLIIRMAMCELWLKRPLNGQRTCSSPQS